MRRARERSGFTLIEVIIALSIGGLVLLMAGRFLSPLTDAAERIRLIDLTAGREARVRRWLQVAFSSLDADERGVGFFDGQATQLVFRARLLTPRGWFEPTSVQLYLESNYLMARLGNGRQLQLLGSVQDAQLDYLAEPGEFPRWGAAWGGATTAPAAVRLRLMWKPDKVGPMITDTLTFRVKGAG
jgi:prepilin-type N-terminal cleavage/methylation domain-containing protein